MKLCKDCKHFDGRNYCKAKAPSRMDYVNGEHKYWSAQSERESGAPEDCGPGAKFFEQRPELSRVSA
jgi:hypothetical protein